MKKICLSALTFLLAIILGMQVSMPKAAKLEATYGFDKIYQIEGGHTLSYYKEYRQEDVTNAINQVNRRKSFGTSTCYLNDGSIIKFRQKIIQRFINTSNSTMEYKLENKEEKTKKFIFGLNGNRGASVEASLKQPTLKGSSTKKLGLDFKQETQTKDTTNESILVKIAPNSIFTYSVEGTGSIISGAASYHIFWIKKWYGLFEYVKVDSLYHQINIERVIL